MELLLDSLITKYCTFYSRSLISTMFS